MKQTDGEEKQESPSNEFVERVSFVDHIHRHLSFSIFGLSFLAVPVGLLAAYGAWGFLAAFGKVGHWLRDDLAGSGGTVQMLELAAGGLVFGLILHFLKWERFRNPAHVIVAVSENGGRLRARDGIVTSLADALSLALGAPVGRYGPAVYLGATIGSIFAQIFRLNQTSIRILLGCGVAGAISASFNAPIAGVIFAHEVIIGHFKLRAFAPITLASVSAVAVSRFHLVEYVGLKLWSVPHQITPGEYPVYLLIGLIAAVVSMAYMAGIMKVSQLAESLKVPVWIQPVLGGLIAGAVALWMPMVLGLGDRSLQAVLEQDVESPVLGLRFLFLLGIAKLIASTCCLGLRYPGGAFTPAIFIGAMLGGCVGFLMPSLDYQISVLVGMGAMVSSVIGAPLAVILIVFELTENYQAATAVMVAVVASNAVVTRFFARSLFHRQIRYWGIEINRPPEQRIMALRSVSEITRRNFAFIGSEMTVGEARANKDFHPGRPTFVVDAGGRLVGHLPGDEWREANEKTAASEFIQDVPLVLSQDESLWSGFEKAEKLNENWIGVVESEDSERLVGYVTKPDFLTAYRRAVQESRLEQ